MALLNFKGFQQKVARIYEIKDKTTKEEVDKKFNEELNKLCIDQIPLFIVTNRSRSLGKGTTLFRSTIPFEGFDEKQINCFSYPNEQFTSLNRCNLPLYPVFYCGDNGNSCIAETINFYESNSLTLYLSEWKVIEDKEWKILPFIFSDIPTGNSAYRYSKSKLEDLQELYKGILPEDDISKYIQYYHDAFLTKDAGKYKSSSLIAHKFLYIDDNDIIVYPTVKRNALSNNFAINPKWVDSGLISLKKIHKFRLEKTESGCINYFLLEIGLPVNEKDVQWRLATEEDVL